MIYKLYRCGSRLLGTESKLTFVTKSTDFCDLIQKATIKADNMLCWYSGEHRLFYGTLDYPGEPRFAISTHKETT